MRALGEVASPDVALVLAERKHVTVEYRVGLVALVVEVVCLNRLQEVAWRRLDDLDVLLLEVALNIIDKCLGLLVVGACIHPRVVTAPWDDDVVLSEMI